MRCISRSITLLASTSLLLAAMEPCALVDGARILAGDLVAVAPAFSALPAETDIAPAPAGKLVRVFYRAQLAALLPTPHDELPDRICVQRKREVIPPSVWQQAIESAMTSGCGPTPWRAKVLEAPQHKYPNGQIQFSRSGIVSSRGVVHLWRGSLILPDKSSIPVWVRVELQSRRRTNILLRPLAVGAVLSAEVYRQEDVWAPGPCATDREPLRVEGLVVRHALRAGTELLREDLRLPPAVHRGQSIELETGSGATRIRIPAVAEQDGEVGEMVRLRSEWNGSKLTGRVTGTRKARVE